MFKKLLIFLTVIILLGITGLTVAYGFYADWQNMTPRAIINYGIDAVNTVNNNNNEQLNQANQTIQEQQAIIEEQDSTITAKIAQIEELELLVAQLEQNEIEHLESLHSLQQQIILLNNEINEMVEYMNASLYYGENLIITTNQFIDGKYSVLSTMDTFYQNIYGTAVLSSDEQFLSLNLTKEIIFNGEIAEVFHFVETVPVWTAFHSFLDFYDTNFIINGEFNSNEDNLISIQMYLLDVVYNINNGQAVLTENSLSGYFMENDVLVTIPNVTNINFSIEEPQQQ